MNLILRSRNGFPGTFDFHRHAFDEHFNSLIDSLVNNHFVHTSDSVDTIEVSPRVTVVENENAFEVEADLPGVNKDNLKVLVEANSVTIEAEVKRSVEHKEGDQVTQKERVTKKFSRTFRLKSDLDETRAVARLENGVLSLTLPKKEMPKAKRILIQ